MRRLLLGLALAGSIVVVAPSSVAAMISWTLTVQPGTASAGVFTTFTLTATNHDDNQELGCLEVTLPASFTIQTIGDPQASNGRNWVATLGGTTVQARSTNGGGRLEEGETVTFTVRAQPNAAGQTAWPNHAHISQHCDDPDQPGVPIALLVTPAQTATPTPTPTPTAAPTPTPPPAATPRPTPIQPPPTPPAGIGTPPASQPPAPSQAGSAPTPRPDPSATPPSATRSPEATSGSGGSPVGSAEPTDDGGSDEGQFAPIPSMDAPTEGVIGLGLEVFDLLDGAHVWFVPAMTVGVPGLLVILWVTLQTVGVLAWLPAVRRMRGAT